MSLVVRADDEDYIPLGHSADHSPIGRKPPSVNKQPVDEENQTLSQRKAALIKHRVRSHRLPQEVLRTIFRMATEEGAIPTAYVLASVCRSWREVIKAMDPEELYTTVSFRHVQHRFSSICKSPAGKKKGPPLSKLDRILQLQSRRWTTGLRALSLAGCSPSPSGLWTIAHACPNLCSLDLSDCANGMRAEELGEVLSALASRTPPLQPLLHLNLSRLRVLPQRSGMDSIVRQFLFAQCRTPEFGPCLQTLRLEDCPTLTLSPLRAICESSIEEATPLLSSLTFLSLAHSIHLVPEDSINMPNLQFATPNLRVLDLDSMCHMYGWRASWTMAGILLDMHSTSGAQVGGNDSVLSPPGWAHLKVARLGAEDLNERRGLGGGIADVVKAVDQSAELEHLSVANSEWVDWVQLLSGLHPDCHLRKLCLARSGSLQPAHTRNLSTILLDNCVKEALSYLEDLDLSGNRFVNDDDVVAVAGCCPNLARIALGGTAVTDKGIVGLVTELGESVGKLKQLEIEACRGVTRELRRVVATEGVAAVVARHS